MAQNPDSRVDAPTTSTKNGIILSFDMGGSHVAAMATAVSSPFRGTIASLALDEGDTANHLFDRMAEVARITSACLTSQADTIE